jgi:DNA-binding NarL/FixJ family response regulator
MRQALVVDDHPVIRDSLQDLLEKSCPNLKVQTSHGDADVVEEICGTPWAFIVLDINLPMLNGLDIIKQARARQNKSPIIVFSLYSEEQYAARAIKAGAIAYLSKDRSPLEVVALAKDILKGNTIKRPTIAPPILSEREVQVLTLLARGMKRREIATKLAINEKTLSTYQIRLYQKLNVRTVVGLVRYAVEEGLVGE